MVLVLVNILFAWKKQAKEEKVTLRRHHLYLFEKLCQYEVLGFELFRMQLFLLGGRVHDPDSSLGGLRRTRGTQ